jgi:putative chitinase
MKFDRKTFFDGFREFNDTDIEQGQVDGLNFLLSAFEADPAWKDPRHVAYALATIQHETAATFKPITEYGGEKYFDKYDVGKLAKKLGNTPEADGDGFKYRGRGYSQITGKANYEKFGIDHDPALALEPIIAFNILTKGMHKGLFTGDKLTNHIKAQFCDYKNARKIINGLDDADQIAYYARNYEKILRNSAVASSSEPSEQRTEQSPSVEQPPSISTKTEVTEEPGKTVAVQETVTAPKGDAPDVPPTKVTVNGPLAKWLFSGGGLATFGTAIWGFVQGNLNAVAVGMICLTLLIVVLIFRHAITDAIRMQTASDPDRKNVS